MTTGPRRTEAGTTLVELLVAVAIMGLSFVIILGGIGTAVIGTGIQRRDTNARLVLGSSAEKILPESAPYLYTPCATAYPDPAPVPDGFKVTVTKVSLWDTATNRFVANVDLGSCTSAPPTDNGFQLIELSVTSTSGAVAPKTETLEIVKRQADS